MGFARENDVEGKGALARRRRFRLKKKESDPGHLTETSIERRKGHKGRNRDGGGEGSEQSFGGWGISPMPETDLPVRGGGPDRKKRAGKAK